MSYKNCFNNQSSEFSNIFGLFLEKYLGFNYFLIKITARKCHGFNCFSERIFNFLLSKKHQASVKLQVKRDQYILKDYERRKKDCSKFHWEGSFLITTIANMLIVQQDRWIRNRITATH